MRPQDPPNPTVAKKPEEEIGLIQGQAPDSINEWYVSLALDKMELYYFYQFSIDMGRSVRGGQVIDFLVDMGGRWVPVYVNGTYWHDIRHDPEQAISVAAARFRFKTEPVILEEAETETKEMALSAVRKKVA